MFPTASLADQADPERVQRIVRFLYTVWYRNWFSRRYAGREAELQTYVDRYMSA